VPKHVEFVSAMFIISRSAFVGQYIDCPVYYYPDPPFEGNCIHKIRPLAPILSQMHPIHAIPPDFFKMHFNIILPFKPGFSKWTLSLSFPHQNTVPLPMCTKCPASNSSLFGHPNYV